MKKKWKQQSNQFVIKDNRTPGYLRNIFHFLNVRKISKRYTHYFALKQWSLKFFFPKKAWTTFLNFNNILLRTVEKFVFAIYMNWSQKKM